MIPCFPAPLDSSAQQKPAGFEPATWFVIPLEWIARKDTRSPTVHGTGRGFLIPHLEVAPDVSTHSSQTSVVFAPQAEDGGTSSYSKGLKTIVAFARTLGPPTSTVQHTPPPDTAVDCRHPHRSYRGRSAQVSRPPVAKSGSGCTPGCKPCIPRHAVPNTLL